MVLVYPGPLPKGALVRETPPPRITDDMLWFDAGFGLTPSPEGRVMAWAAKGQDAVVARAVPANDKGTAVQSAPAGLRFETGLNRGHVLSDTVADQSLVTCAVIFWPELPEPRTILSLQALGTEDYLFLACTAEEEGLTVLLGQRVASEGLSLPVTGQQGAPVLLVCSIGQGKVWVAVNGGDPVVADVDLAPQPADLFLGCRSLRGGLKNKHGAFVLSDVLVWPGRDLIGSGDRAGLTRAEAIWQERARRGI